MFRLLSADGKLIKVLFEAKRDDVTSIEELQHLFMIAIGRTLMQVNN